MEQKHSLLDLSNYKDGLFIKSYVSLPLTGSGNIFLTASCGNNNLGGSDFDRKIMEFCIGKFIEINNLDPEEFIEKVEEIEADLKRKK